MADLTFNITEPSVTVIEQGAFSTTSGPLTRLIKVDSRQNPLPFQMKFTVILDAQPVHTQDPEVHFVSSHRYNIINTYFTLWFRFWLYSRIILSEQDY